MKKIPLGYLIVFIYFIVIPVVADTTPLSVTKMQQLFSECQIPQGLTQKFTAIQEQNQRLQQENNQIKADLQATHELLIEMQQQVRNLIAIQQQMSQLKTK